MKRVIPWVVGAGAVALAVTFYVRGSQARPKEPSKAAPAPAASAPEKVAYTFQDEAQVKTFTDLWEKRQGIAVRMAVLKNYWEGEQAAITKFNADLQRQYGFDPNKNYSLDTQKRMLVERKAPQPPAAAPSAEPSASAPAAGQPVQAQVTPAAGQPAATADTSAPAHTFANEDEMKAFATLWQQRQTATIRSAALQSLWDEQKVELVKLSDTIASTYKLDPSKDYALDAKRRALVERPAPTALPAQTGTASQADTPPASPATR